MKHISLLALSAITAMSVSPMMAHSAPLSHFQANGVITSNIAAMQHSIMLNMFDNFGAEIELGEYSAIKSAADIVDENKDDCGCEPVYGAMIFYGEYGDDTGILPPEDKKTVETGHSGGDLTESHYNWFNWRHAQDTAKFDGFDKIDSRYDLISMGFANEPELLSVGFSQFGGFGGLILANEDADTFEISETGGYLGFYRGYHISDFNFTIAADGGLLFSDSKAALGDYDFMNFWAGAALNASYDIALSQRLMLQPGAYAGYTYIYSEGFESDTGKELSIKGSHMFEVSPSLRAIINIAEGWRGSISGRYVFNFPSNGDIKVAGVTMPELELDDYSEFAITIDRNAERFGFSATGGYHNGGRTGWFGGIQLRYVF